MPVEGLQVGDTPFSVIGIFYTNFGTFVASLCGLLKSNAMDINESMSLCKHTHPLTPCQEDGPSGQYDAW